MKRMGLSVLFVVIIVIVILLILQHNSPEKFSVWGFL